MTTATRIAKPLFLVGAERSGTTLLRLILDGHPQIAWCSEFEYAVDLLAPLPLGEFPNVQVYHEWLSTSRIFAVHQLTINPNLSYPDLVDDFLQQMRDRKGKPFIGATVHQYFDRLLSIWPDARFIHIVRDPRDVALSCVAMGWEGNVWAGTARWVEAEQLWARMCQTLTPERYMTVYYEDIVAKADESLVKLCNFIGVDYDSVMLTYPQRTTYTLLNPKHLYKWRKKLTPRQIQLIEARTQPWLSQHGYETSGELAITMSSLYKQQLKWHSWWKRVRFRMRRLGLRLLLADYLSRKLGLKEWQKRIRLQLNEIDKQYLQ